MSNNGKKTQEFPAVQDNKGIGRGRAPGSAVTQFQPGQSGHPSGRPQSAGSSIREWENSMAFWGEKELQDVLNDPDQPSAKVHAARVTMLGRSGERSKSGTPICLEAISQICDQTAGKPVQSVELSVGDESAKAAVDFDFPRFASMFALMMPAPAPEPAKAISGEITANGLTPSVGADDAQNRGGRQMTPFSNGPNGDPEIIEPKSFAPIIVTGAENY